MGRDARLIETEDGFAVVEPDGTTWDVCVDDARGHYAVERDVGEHWVAGEFNAKTGTVFEVEEGDTFGVNCQDEFIVEETDGAGSLRWSENDEDES